MRHQLSLQHLEPQYFCTLRPLVWNVPCCPPDEVLPPSFCPGLGPAGLLSAPCPSPGGRYGSSLSSQNPRQVLKTSLHLSVSVPSSPWCELLENRNLALLMVAAPWLVEPGALLARQGMWVGGWEGAGGGQSRVAAEAAQRQ